jgi:hypothetical protein
MLSEKQVGVVICKNIGPEPIKKFNSLGMQVYLGANGTVADGIRQYKNAQLILTSKPNVPSHYGIPGQAPCPNVPGQPKTRIENPMLPVDTPGALASPVALSVNNQPIKYSR